jgi:hypothetical protein
MGLILRSNALIGSGLLLGVDVAIAGLGRGGLVVRVKSGQFPNFYCSDICLDLNLFRDWLARRQSDRTYLC